MNDTIQSLREQLAEAEENLRLIRERKAEYVLETDVPLQLVKDERRLEAQIADLRARLARLTETPCPYRGLEPFEAEHAKVYFGRETMVERLVAKVSEASFVAVVGPSGCGKSSLMRAGLVTALRQGALPGSRDWAIRIFRPGRDPLRALAAGLVALLEPEASEVDRMAETRKLAGHLRDGTLTMDDVTARLREVHPDLPHLLLVADQFEELYTECDDEAGRRAFVNALLAVAETEWVTVLLTLRADFYGRVLEDRALGERVDTGLVNVLPMSEKELRAAIEKPALKTGREFEPGLVDDILKGVAGEPGNLPLLEFALTELWDGQMAAGLLTHAAYKEIGGVEGAIARRAEAAYEGLEERGQGETVRRIFLRLTHYGEGAEGTRRRATLDDLMTLRTPRAAVEPVVKALADARLLVTGRDEATGAATVEAAHEALIRGWARLRRWLDEDRAFGLWRDRLAVARRTWEEMGWDEGALLRGAPLAEAEGWLAERGDDLNKAERGFIGESVALCERERAARERRRRRLTLAAVGTALIFLILALVAGFQWRRAEEQRQIAVARQLAAQAQMVLGETGTDLVQSTLLAVESLRRHPSLEGDQALRRGMGLLLQPVACMEHEGAVWAVAFSPKGQWVASGSWDGTARVWDATTGQEVARMEHEGSVNVVVFSPDGQWVVSGSDDSTVRVWEAATGREVARMEHGGPVLTVAFSPDGQWVASGGRDNTVRVWEATTGEEMARMDHRSTINTVTFSPDGQWVASGGRDNTVLVWETFTGKEVARAEHEGVVRSLAFSPDGQWVVSVSEDYTLGVWEAATGEEVARMAHQDVVRDLAFSADGWFREVETARCGCGRLPQGKRWLGWSINGR